MNENVVFFDRDKKRIKSIRRIITMALFVSVACVFTFIYSFLYTPEISGQKYIDRGKIQERIFYKISDQTGPLRVYGEGPRLEILSQDGEDHLVRAPFEQDNLVILTFDDGPDPVYTPLVLDVLREKDVKAIFFLIGDHMVRYPEVTRQIANDGHLIGVHTFNHVDEDSGIYKAIGKRINPVGLQLDLAQKVIIAQTGYKSNLFRIPNWGAEDTITKDTLVFAYFATEKGYNVISVTTDSRDWAEDSTNAIVANSVRLEGSQIILLHDAGGDRSATVDALPEIIDKYKAVGFTFTTNPYHMNVYGDVYEKPSIKEVLASKLIYSLMYLERNLHAFVEFAFMLAIVVAVGSISAIMSLAVYQYIRARNNKIYIKDTFAPMVSVIVPAYNEEKTIEKTLSSILKSDYPNFEIVFVNNNSNDKTLDIVSKFKNHHNIKICHEKVQGKYAAINKGVIHSKGEICIVIDADTQLLPDSIANIVKPMHDERVGAVLGFIMVGNVNNLLTKFQSIEYISSLNLERRAFDVFSSATVVPGAFGAWRKDAIIKAGWYKNDTLVEDADLAVEIQKLGYKSAYAPSAIAYTEAPETLLQLMKQRQRWTFGILQVMYKNRDMFFKNDAKALSRFIMPYIAFFQVPSLLLAPFVDILAIYLFFMHPGKVLIYLTLFLSIKVFESAVAFAMSEKRDFRLLLYVPLMRFSFQFLWYFNLYRCVYKAVRGEMLSWDKLPRVGSVRLPRFRLAYAASGN